MHSSRGVLREVEVAVQPLAAVPLVAVVIGAIGSTRLQAPWSPVVLVVSRTEGCSCGIELIGAAAVEQSCSGIFVLRAELYVQSAPARLQVDVRPSAVAVGERLCLFLGRRGSIVAVSTRIFGRGIELHLAHRTGEGKLRVHKGVHAGSKFECGKGVEF